MYRLREYRKRPPVRYPINSLYLSSEQLDVVPKIAFVVSLCWSLAENQNIHADTQSLNITNQMSSIVTTCSSHQPPLVFVDCHWLSLTVVGYHWLSLAITDRHWLSPAVTGCQSVRTFLQSGISVRGGHGCCIRLENAFMQLLIADWIVHCSVVCRIGCVGPGKPARKLDNTRWSRTFCPGDEHMLHFLCWPWQHNGIPVCGVLANQGEIQRSQHYSFLSSFPNGSKWSGGTKLAFNKHVLSYPKYFLSTYCRYSLKGRILHRYGTTSDSRE